MDLLKNFSQTTVANLPTRISWICVKLLGLLKNNCSRIPMEQKSGRKTQFGAIRDAGQNN